MSWERRIVVEGFEFGDYCYSCTMIATGYPIKEYMSCLLYTSDAADD
jgi:hypothetical protein